MKNYLSHTFNYNDPELISVVDELPLWSAPFGLKLLQTVTLKSGINFLDIGCGPGFPLIELAQRFGNSSKGYGIDPWEPAIERVRLKIQKYGYQNIEIVKGTAEAVPFTDNFFSLIVSNNGINNVQDIDKTLKECYRISKPGAQFVFTMNLEESMIEFYSVFESVLYENGLSNEIKKMKEHISVKRPPLDRVKELLTGNGFLVNSILTDSFRLSFLNAEAMFNYSLIKYWFLGAWKALLNESDLENIFEQIENKLNILAQKKGAVHLTIPFATIDCSCVKE